MFWLGLSEMEPKMLDLMVLERTICVPYFDHIACAFDKDRSK